MRGCGPPCHVCLTCLFACTVLKACKKTDLEKRAYKAVDGAPVPGKAAQGAWPGDGAGADDARARLKQQRGSAATGSPAAAAAAAAAACAAAATESQAPPPPPPWPPPPVVHMQDASGAAGSPAHSGDAGGAGARSRAVADAARLHQRGNDVFAAGRFHRAESLYSRARPLARARPWVPMAAARWRLAGMCALAAIGVRGCFPISRLDAEQAVQTSKEKGCALAINATLGLGARVRP